MKFVYGMLGLFAAASLWSAEDSTAGLVGRSDQAQVVSASSTAELVETQFGGDYLYPPANVLDGVGATTWAPGGRGIGQELTLSFADPLIYDEIQLVNGFAGKNDLYTKNNRIKTIRIAHIAGASHFQSQDFPLADKKPEWQSITFAQPQLAKTVSFSIQDVYPGAKYDDTCLSDIRFLYQGKVIPYVGGAELLAFQTKASKALLGKNSEQDFRNGYLNAPLVSATGLAYYFTSDGQLYSGEYQAKDSDFIIDEEGDYSLKGNRVVLSQTVGYVETHQTLVFIPDGSKGLTINGQYFQKVIPQGKVQFDY